MATTMSTHPAAAPPHSGGGAGSALLVLLGLAGVGGAGWWILTHRGGTTTPPVAAPASSGGCPAGMSQAQTLWSCVLGNQGPAPDTVANIMLGYVSFLVQSGHLSQSQATQGWLPSACSVCWDRLPTGCANAC